MNKKKRKIGHQFLDGIFFVVLFALSQIGLVWEYRSREKCIAVNNKVLMFLLDSDNHENCEYVGCCSSMKPDNLGDY